MHHDWKDIELTEGTAFTPESKVYVIHNGPEYGRFLLGWVTLAEEGPKIMDSDALIHPRISNREPTEEERLAIAEAILSGRVKHRLRIVESPYVS